MKARMEWLDFLRGILILLVVIGHVLGKWIGEVTLVDYAHKVIYTFHMPAFMLLSGYSWAKFSEKRITCISEYIIKKAIALLIPYAVFSIGFGCMKLLAGSDNTINPIEVKDILLFPLKPLDYLWFLYSLFIFECIAVFFLKIVKGKMNHLLFSSIGLHLLSYFIVSEYFALNRSLHLMIFFVIGILWGQREDVEVLRSKTNSSIICTVFFVAEICYLYIFPKEGLVPDTISSILSISVCAFLGAFFIFYMGKIIGTKNSWTGYRIISLIGRYSIVFYLVHQPIISVVRVLLIKVRLTASIWQVLFMFLGTMIIAACVCFLTTKIKLIEFFFYPGKYIGIKNK